MIYYLEPLGKNAWNIVGLPTNPEESIIHIHVAVPISNSDRQCVLTKKTCNAIDILFAPNATLYWRSALDMQLFLSATKSHLKFQIKKQSVCLPDAVLACLAHQKPVTPQALTIALEQNEFNPKEIHDSRSRLLKHGCATEKMQEDS